MQITLEGHDQPVPVRAGDTMLEALLRAGVAFPFSCQAGNCGTCKCELVSGDILELEHSEHALAPEAARARLRTRRRSGLAARGRGPAGGPALGGSLSRQASRPCRSRATTSGGQGATQTGSGPGGPAAPTG